MYKIGDKSSHNIIYTVVVKTTKEKRRKQYVKEND